MYVYKQYDEIIRLQEALKVNPKLAFFLDSYQQDLVSLFDDLLATKKITKKALLDALRERQSQLATKVQTVHLQRGLHEEKILPLTSALERKRKEALAKINYLPMILQLACSHPEYYFRKNFECDTSHKELIDYVVIDPNSLPQGFLDVFQIESLDIEGKNIKELFKRAEPLHYHKEKSTKTRRVIFIDGKLVIFRELQQLLHKEEHLTQGEKRRVDYKKYFNAFEDIYSAVRSQQHIVDKEEKKINDYHEFQQKAIELIQDLKVELKQGDEKKKLDEIIDGIKHATSFPIMASKFYNLFQIDFINKSIAANRVVGASNKISKELHMLRTTILEIQLQTDALHLFLDTQEYALQTLYTKISQSLREQNGPSFVSAFRTYYTQLSHLPQKTEPFLSFEQEIRQIFGNVAMIDKMKRNEAVLKAEILFALQKIRLQAYQLEHALKSGTVTHRDFVFDASISAKYSDVDKAFFGNITPYIHAIQNFATVDMSQKDVDVCISLLQQLKKLPDRKSNIQALQAM